MDAFITHIADFAATRHWRCAAIHSHHNQSEPDKPEPTASCLVSEPWRPWRHSSRDHKALFQDHVKKQELARTIQNQYENCLISLYDLLLHHRKISKDKSNTLSNINLNVPARGMKGILVLFEGCCSATALCSQNGAILYPEGNKSTYNHRRGPQSALQSRDALIPDLGWGKEVFGVAGSNRHPDAAMVAKDLALADATLTEFLTDKSSQWLDLRQQR